VWTRAYYSIFDTENKRVGFATAAAAIVGVMLTIGGAVMVPVFGDLRELGDNIKDVQRISATNKDMETLDRSMQSRGDKLSQLVEALTADKIGVREHNEFKDHIESRISAFEKTQDSRFLDFDKTVTDRFSLIVSRLDAISARITEGLDPPKAK
jgi:hypothetical protein